MIKKSCLLMFAVLAASCSSANAQSFTTILPSDLGISGGPTGINQTFDISTPLGLPVNTATLVIFNGHVNENSGNWTVADGSPTSFAISGVEVEAFVSHGSNLGPDALRNGSRSRDGISSLNGETWTLVSNLDDDYTEGFSGNDYFVDYEGDAEDELQSNSEGFRWESDGATAGVTVFSNNTVDFNNNYSIGFSVVTAVPEPASGLIAAFGSLVFLRRKRA